MLQFVCDVKDTGKDEYLRQFIRIELDWIPFFRACDLLVLAKRK